MCLHLFIMLRPEHLKLSQLATCLLLVADCVLSMPYQDALIPAVIAVFSIYSLLLLSFYVALAANIFISVLQTCIFVLFTSQLRTNELLATILVHIWCHFIGIYLYIQRDRLARSAFLSGRNSVEAETAAELQSSRLNRLLSTFLPPHLITAARHQITLYNPHIYAEHYQQVTVAYGRLIGLEAILSQCSSLDAARVVKEFDERIERLAECYACTRIMSEGITVVSSIPAIDAQHALKVCRFALDLENLVNSFRDATTADVAVCVGIDSGPVSCGIVGASKWHYDVIGASVDNAILLESNAPKHGVFITDETRRLVGDEFEMEKIGEVWRLISNQNGVETFPVNKRYSLVTVPQAINRLLQTVATPSLKTTTKKRKTTKSDVGEDSKTTGSFMKTTNLQFKNEQLEGEYHKEMDHWFIPAITISIFFLVIYGVYHMLVMPRQIVSVVLILIALTVMFSLLLVLYINYFQNFSQFITRTFAGYSITVLIVLLTIFICGIVNTFSCPESIDSAVCGSIHYSAFSFVLWMLTCAVFLRFSSFYMLFLLSLSILVYSTQIIFNHPPIGPKQFGVEIDIFCFLVSLAVLVYLHSRSCEKLMRLDFLSVVKGVEETSTKDNLLLLNSQVLLNLVPPHVAPIVANRTPDLWHHAHHSVGVAYLAVSGFDLQGEQGMNGLNYVFSYFDQALANFRGIEKIQNASRFYIVAVGMLPDTTHNVEETPWTIGELLNTLTNFLIHVTQFATDKEFQVQIGVDCGSALTVVANTERPRYELWGDTVEKARILMQSASHERILTSEEIYLALRPRHFRFAQQAMKVIPNLNAYVLYCRDDDVEIDDVTTTLPLTLPKEEQEKHTQLMFDAAKKPSDEFPSSMASSFSSELQSIDDDAETDSDIEWITPDTALMDEPRTSKQKYSLGRRSNYRNTDYDPYRVPYRKTDENGYKADQSVQYSDWSEQENSRAASRSSNYRGKRGWKYGSKGSLRNPLKWLRKGSSVEVDSLNDPGERLEAAATRVDQMIQELNAYGDYSQVKPLEYCAFPTAFGSIKSIHRAMSSACHTEYDNADSEAFLSDVESEADISNSNRIRNREKHGGPWRREGTDADAESQCSSVAGSIDLNHLRWHSVHSVGYENEYEMTSDGEGLAIEEMKALSRDIRKNFGDFQLATFDDIDQD